MVLIITADKLPMKREIKTIFGTKNHFAFVYKFNVYLP